MSADKDPIYLGNIWGKKLTRFAFVFLVVFSLLVLARYLYLVKNDRWDPDKYEEIQVTK